MYPSVLFVCSGNICRSPLAAAVLRKQAAELGVTLRVDSAGANGWHIGQGADARAVVAARVNGMELSNHVARTLTTDDLESFDLILVTDHEVYEQIAKRAPERLMAKVSYLTSFGQGDVRDIPDPYYTGRFDPLIAQLEDCVAGVICQAITAQ